MTDYPSSDLAALIEEGYREHTTPAPQWIGVCTACCMKPDDAEEVLRSPIRDMPERLVNESSRIPDQVRWMVTLWP